MHIALVNIPADAISVGMEAGVAEAAVAGLQVLAGAVLAHARDHGALVDVGAAVVLTGTRRTQH